VKADGSRCSISRANAQSHQARSSLETVVGKVVLLVTSAMAIGAPEIREANRAYFRIAPGPSRSHDTNLGFVLHKWSVLRATRLSGHINLLLGDLSNKQSTDKTSEMDGSRINNSPRIDCTRTQVRARVDDDIDGRSVRR
jgi:hypothetical protein